MRQNSSNKSRRERRRDAMDLGGGEKAEGRVKEEKKMKGRSV